MAGVALIMIGSQLATITGVTLTSDGAIAKTVELSGKAGDVQPAAVVLGLGVTAFLLILQRVAPLAPGSLIAVVGAAVIVYVFDLAARGIALVGPVPSGLPSVSLPALSARRRDRAVRVRGGDRVRRPTPTSRSPGARSPARTGEVIDANREFLGLGVANVASGLTGGFALSASGSRTAIIDAVRAHSQVTGLVAAASVVVVVLAVPGLIALHPAGGAGRDRRVRRAAPDRRRGAAATRPVPGVASSGWRWPRCSACSCSTCWPGS